MQHIASKRVITRLAAAAQGVLMLGWAVLAAAEPLPDPTAIADPPPLHPRDLSEPKPKKGTLQLQNFMSLPALSKSESGVFDKPEFLTPDTVDLDLEVAMLSGKIRNPSADKEGEAHFDRVLLRGYRPWCDPGENGKPCRASRVTKSFIAPLIQAHPGQTVRITLHNDLPPDPSCVSQGGSANKPHCFNGTNLHTHGLWINPAGNSDNVLLAIHPGVAFQYEYNIPLEHPAGTYWYHTHLHGSTALQVSSGMAGALIIRGNRQPQLDGNQANSSQKNSHVHGDLDTLLVSRDKDQFQEHTFVFQQIQYACRGKDRKIKTKNDEEGGPYRCDDGDIGQVDGYDLFGPGRWEKSGRYTSINGVVMGKLQNAKVGKVQRWRMIHGGVRDTIALEIRRREPISNESAQSISGLTAEQTQDYVNKECTGEPIPFTLVAADGLTMAQAMQKKRLVFQPGYRWDALMVFPQAGDYCLINKVGRSNIDLVQPYTRLLGMIHVNAANMPVVPDDIDGSIKRHLQNLLIKAAQDNYRSAVAKLVVADLRNDMKLTRFVPHADIQDSELTGQQRLAFNIDTQSVKGQSFYQIDGKPYDGGRIDRTLPLGGVDEWTLTSDFASHPFHIHVNPFQIVKIINPKGQDISGPMPQADDDDDQYHGMKGMWKDTLWIKSLFDGTSGGEKDAAAGRYTFIVRTRYQRYVGDFVLHCHILDHEDQGMMQNVRIVLPDAQGNLTAGHH